MTRNPLTTFLISCGATIAGVDAVLYFAVRAADKWHGRGQLVLAGCGAVMLVAGLLRNNRQPSPFSRPPQSPPSQPTGALSAVLGGLDAAAGGWASGEPNEQAMRRLQSQQCDRLREIIAHVSYKPGSEFLATPLPNEAWGIRVTLTIHVRDVQSPQLFIAIQCQHILRATDLAGQSDPVILCHLFDLAAEIERHEACEWLKYRGECIVDPHPELKRKEEVRLD